MPISASDIKDVVLKEDDFGHEMRVGKVIRAISGIQIEHGGTYIDSVTGKPRQFDFRCSLRKDSAELHLAVECKNLNPSAPLVMCGTKRQNNEAFHDLIESRLGSASPGKKNVLYVSGTSSATFRASRDNAFYLPGKFVGKSLVRIKPAPNSSSGNSFVSVPDSDIYDKWSQALSSSVDLAELACDRAGHYRAPKFYTIVLPVVVVPDDSLWIVDYDDSGCVCKPPEQVNACELFVGREIKVTKEWFPHQFTLSHIHFFTIGGFASFLSDMAPDDNNWIKNTWVKFFTGQAQEIC